MGVEMSGVDVDVVRGETWESMLVCKVDNDGVDVVDVVADVFRHLEVCRAASNLYRSFMDCQEWLVTFCCSSARMLLGKVENGLALRRCVLFSFTHCRMHG